MVRRSRIIAGTNLSHFVISVQFPPAPQPPCQRQNSSRGDLLPFLIGTASYRRTSGSLIRYGPNVASPPNFPRVPPRTSAGSTAASRLRAFA